MITMKWLVWKVYYGKLTMIWIYYEMYKLWKVLTMKSINYEKCNYEMKLWKVSLWNE